MTHIMYIMHIMYMWKSDMYMGQAHESKGSMHIMHISSGFFRFCARIPFLGPAIDGQEVSCVECIVSS
jgi:hypothetical protein